EFVRGAEDLPRATGARHRSLYRLDRENVVLRAVLDQQRARRDQGGKVAELPELEHARHEVAQAMIDRQDAVAPVAEVPADDGSLDAGVDARREERVHAAAADAHHAQT